MTDYPVALLVAAADNQVIGRNNALPWDLPADLAHFKRQTMGKPILMGRKTFESIGRPLPGVVHSREDAMTLADDIALIDGAEELVAICGAQIYEAALAQAERIYLTRVHASPTGDAYFPDLDAARWQETARESHDAEGTKPAYTFLEYTRTDA